MKHTVVKALVFLILIIATASVATPTYWRILKPGIEYTRLSVLSGFHVGYIHALKIDLSQYKLQLAIAEDDRNQIETVRDLTINNKGIIGVNGGFFSQELKPLGLRITDSRQRNPLKFTPWWGVFYIAKQQPYIVSLREFKPSREIQFAIQSGPRLVSNNKIPTSLKPGTDSRTAIGISKDNKVVLVVTENLSLTTKQFAQILNAKQGEGGLECKSALNLDGGSSTQLYVGINNFSLDVSGYSAVTDAILVISRE